MPWKIAADPRIAAQAVERQMRNWELLRSQRIERPEERRREVEEFITLSREVGAPAAEVAAELAEQLGWPVFGRNLLETMAGDDALRRRIYESLDQRDLQWWQESLFALSGEGLVRNDYFRRLCETVLSLARQGHCIFIGRGCDRLLPASIGVRVRLVAPLADRIARLREERGIAAAAARREIDRVERERARFLRHHFGVEADDLTRHDVAVNLGRVTPREAAGVILAVRTIKGG